MTIRYATAAQFTAVHCIPGVTSSELQDTWLVRASLALNEGLAGQFALPLSSNNQSARELTIDIAKALILSTRTGNRRDSEEIWTYINSRLGAFRNGMPMINDDGTFVEVSGSDVTVWGNRELYKPIFDVRDTIFQRVDPDLRDKLHDDDT